MSLLQTLIEDAPTDFDRERLQHRLAKMKGGVAVVRPGGRSEIEMNETRDRIEDAVHAVRAAVEEGVVIGGGCAILYASKRLGQQQAENEEQKVGLEIVKNSCSKPLEAIYANATRESGAAVVEKLLT